MTNPIENVDLGVIVAPRAPAGFADGVLARFASTEVAIAVEQRRRARRMTWRIGGAIVAVAAVVSLVLAWPHHPARERAVADQPRLVTIGDTRVELAARATIEWRREGNTLLVEQHGAATWHLSAGEHLHVEVPGAGAVDATGATLNLEVTMNADVKTVGSATVVLSTVTVAVVAGKAMLAGGGANLTVEQGKAAAVSAGQRPVEVLGPRNPATSVVIVFPADETWLANGRLEAIESALTRLDLPLGSTVGAMTYTNRAETAFFSKPVYQVRGSELGTLERYRGKSGTALVEGVNMGIDMLRASGATRRLVVVLGDGRDRDDGAITRLMKDLAEAQIDGIEVKAILTRPQTSDLFDSVWMPKIYADPAELSDKIVDMALGKRPPLAVTVVFPATQRWLDFPAHRLAIESLASEQLASQVNAVSYSPTNPAPVDSQLQVVHEQGDVLEGARRALHVAKSADASRHLVLVIDDGDITGEVPKRLDWLMEDADRDHIEVKVFLARDQVAMTPSVFEAAGVPVDDVTSRSILYALRDAVGLAPSKATAVMVLYAGRGTWMTEERLAAIGRGLENLDLATGSRIAAVEYSTGYSTRVGWESAEAFKATQLGSVADYASHVGSDLMVGLDAAVDALAAQPQPNKLLVLVGDGKDTDQLKAFKYMFKVKEAADAAHIVVRALNVRDEDGGDHSFVGDLDPRVKTIPAGSEQARELELTIAGHP